VNKASETSIARAESKGIDWRQAEGLIFGLIGVIGFSMTLPATRAAVPELGSVLVGLGRALISAVVAAALLLARHEPFPERRYWRGLAVVALGVVVGFPLCSALALAQLPAAHSAVVIGLLPASTAVMAVLRTEERPPRLFWLSCSAGVISVLLFAASSGAGLPQPADLLLLLAVLLGGLGYAEGGRLARELGGGQVICWALIFAAPLLVAPVILSLGSVAPTVSAGAWLGFAYVAAVNVFLAAWYRGLALGGVAKVGQVQLIQPVLTLTWSALLLGEPVGVPTTVAALLVIASAALSQWSWRNR
jgi:drug/metabolite transporter (DMT)-like permease